MLPYIFKTIIFSFFILFFFVSACSGLTLSESIQTALENNPEVLAQQERVKAHEARVGQAFSGFLPQINLEGELGKDYRTPVSYSVAGSTFTLYPDEAGTVTGLRAVFSQNIFTGGEIRSRLEIEKIGLEIEKEELKRIEQEVSYKAALAYFKVLHAQAFVALSQEFVQVAQEHLGLVQKYYALGRVPRTDLLRAQVRVAEEENRAAEAENAVALARVDLNNVLGKDIGEETVPEDMEGGENGQDPSLAAGEDLYAVALQNRAEWKGFQLRKLAGGKQIDLARSGYLPDLTLNGGVARDIADYSANAIRRETDSWNVYGLVSWTVFDGLSTQNRVREAQARLLEIAAQERLVKNRIQTEVEQARLNQYAARRRVRGAKKTVALTQENLALARQRYLKGAANNIEFLEAQAALARAKADLLWSGLENRLAAMRLDLALGKELLAGR